MLSSTRALCAALVCMSVVSAARGAITTTGSVYDSGSDVYVAHLGPGTLTIDGGSVLDRDGGEVGHAAGQAGLATITGTGSAWNHTGQLEVGSAGDGTAIVSSGGSVSAKWCMIGVDSNVRGAVSVGGTNSTWTVTSSINVGRYGIGSVELLSGATLATGGGHIGTYTGGNGSVKVYGGATWNATGWHYIGSQGTGTVEIVGGATVTGGETEIGYHPGSNGTVTVLGSGSTWSHTDDVSVAYRGRGTLNILDGAAVTCDYGRVGYDNGVGEATVSGAGSSWTSQSGLSIGGVSKPGRGTLTVRNGGVINSKSIATYNSQSKLIVHVTGNDVIVLGNASQAGVMVNHGTLRFYADASLAAGTYTPIADLLGRSLYWYNYGSYEAIGGVWNASARTFTVGATAELAAGDVATVASGERVQFTHASSGASVGASFGSVPGGTTFSAYLMSQADLNLLLGTPGVEGRVLAGWDFATGLTGSNVLLSFNVGTGMSDIQAWHFDGSTWTQVSPGQVGYDAAGNVNFTASQFSGYAITGVPEPATLCLLALGLPLLRRRRAG